MAKIVFVGNCQVQSVCNAYNSFVSPWTGETATFVDAYAFTPDKVGGLLEGADILVGQVAEFKSHIDIDDVPAHVVKYRIPVVSAGFLWPFGGQPHPKTVSLPYMPLGPYSAEFGDSYLNRMINKNKGVDFDEILEKYLKLDVNKLVNLDRLLELNLEKQRNRDRLTGFNVADIIEEYFRDEHIFLTPYHPNLRVARYLIQQTFRVMGVEQRAIDRVQKWLTITPFPKTGNPIHPSVQRHFGLKYAEPDYQYRYFSEGTFTFEQFVSRYLRYEWNETLEEGLALAQDRKFDAAIEKITIGLQRSPQSSNGFHTLSGVLDSIGRVDEAIAAVRRAVELEPDNAAAVRHLGVLLGRTEHVQESEELLRKAIALSPGSAEYYAALAHLLQRQKRLDEATVVLKEAVERNPVAPNYRTHYASLLEAKGELAEAEQVLRRTIEAAPDDAHAHNTLSHVLAKQNRLAEAIAAARRAVELQPDNIAYIGYLGHLLTRDGQDAEAERVLARAIEMSPGTAGFYNDLSQLFERQGRAKEAATLLQQVIARGTDDVPIHARLAHLYLRSEDLAAAEREYRKAAELEPGNAAFRASQADMLARQGKRDEAVTVLREAIAGGMSDPQIHGLLGHILSQGRDYKGAEREFRTAMEKAADGSRFGLPLADVLNRQGKWDEAVGVLRDAIARGASDPHVHGLLGHMLLQAQDLDGAEHEFRTAMEKASDGSNFRAALAQVLERLGRREEAAALVAGREGAQRPMPREIVLHFGPPR
jgi:tetratricopeptide (TPR) repeat protein